VSGQPAWLWWSVAAIVVAVVLAVWFVWLRGRPFASGAVFRASRISRGNRLLPTQVLITPTSVVHYTPGWIGRQEATIHISHVAMVKIETGMLLSDVFIETSGGEAPIRCHGHSKGDAVRMKELIETYQNDYYRGGARQSARPVAAPAASSPSVR
jgi:hypothetical protein